jgi:glycosyltransferase involved in cell wall biosynthesis
MTTNCLETASAGLAANDDDLPQAPLGVSVVVPMYNERECVGSLLTRLDEVTREMASVYEFEFVLVDDGSTDGTVELLQAALAGRQGFRIVRHEKNQGIGAAIQTGLRESRHEIVASIDSDGSYDPALIAELAPLLRPGVDLVTASPYHSAGHVENVPAWRLAISRLASRLYGVACGERLSCYTSCFRIYRRATTAPIVVENLGFVGVAELLCRVLENGGVVVEHPAVLRGRMAGHSKMRVVRASLGHFYLIGQIIGRRMLRRSTLVLQTSSDEKQELSY